MFNLIICGYFDGIQTAAKEKEHWKNFGKEGFELLLMNDLHNDH